MDDPGTKFMERDDILETIYTANPELDRKTDCRTCCQNCQYIGCHIPSHVNCPGYLPITEKRKDLK